MKQQAMLRIAFAASMLVVASAATAHGDHDHAPKLKSQTCEQFAERTRYSNDLSDPDIRALKDMCDALKTDASSSDMDATKKE